MWAEQMKSLKAHTPQQSLSRPTNVPPTLPTTHNVTMSLDNLPAWFLRLGAPIFYKPLTYLFNLSLSNSVVPIQWKLAWIRPIPKVSAPALHSDYRPISITPVLSRMLEKIVVRRYIYPVILKHLPVLSVSDQFAYMPTGPLQPSSLFFTQLLTPLHPTHML